MGSLHVPNKITRATVKALTSYGVNQLDIAAYIGISDETLRKHYEKEIKKGAIEANAKVAAALFSKAVDQNDVTAQIFWLKTRGRWKERTEPSVMNLVIKEDLRTNTTDPIEAAKIYQQIMQRGKNERNSTSE